MDWDHLRVFIEVARTGQILAAGRRLGLNHATVARRISSLEEQLRTKLFERRTSGCDLTAEGERLLSIAERVETEILQAQSTIGNTDLALQGTVRIGTPDGFGSYFLAPHLGKLVERHPELKIQLAPLPHSFSLPKREVDIAVTIMRPTEGRLVARKLTDYSLGVYAARSYLRRSASITALDDLNGQTLITYVPDLAYSAALNYYEAFNGISARRLECASVVGQLEAVKAGAGIGILHDYATTDYPELIRILPELRFQRSYWLVTHADVRGLRRVREVEAFIVEEVRAQRSRFISGEDHFAAEESV